MCGSVRPFEALGVRWDGRFTPTRLPLAHQAVFLRGSTRLPTFRDTRARTEVQAGAVPSLHAALPTRGSYRVPTTVHLSHTLSRSYGTNLPTSLDH